MANCGFSEWAIFDFSSTLGFPNIHIKEAADKSRNRSGNEN